MTKSPYKSEAISTLIDTALKELPKNAPNGQRDMLGFIGREIAAEDVDLFDKALLKEISGVHWDLTKKREPGKPKINIHVSENEQGSAQKTLIDIVCDDYSFLIDSVIADINKYNLLITILVHPMLYAEYDKNNAIKTIQSERNDSFVRQSHIHIQIIDALSQDMIEALEKDLYQSIDDVYIANRDWKKMLARLHDAKMELSHASLKLPLRELEKYCSFLDYVYNNNFTLLGYREYEFAESKGEIKSKTLKGRGLGVLSDDIKPAYLSESKEGLPTHLQIMRKELPPVVISKTNRLSTVHRRVPMDAIAVKTYDEKGKVKGEKLFLGLFTSVTYSRSVSSVPYLKEKVEDVISMSGFIKGSHDRKALRHILEKYPRDELFQIDTEELYETSLNILRLQERQRIALFMRKDTFGRYISCLVYVPRDRFESKLREQISIILEHELNGECLNFYTTMDDSMFARIMFNIKIKQNDPPDYNQDEIEQKLQEVGKTWPEHLLSTLREDDDHRSDAKALVLRYGEAFPVSYTLRYKPKQAIFDIEKIEDVIDSDETNIDLYRPEGTELNNLRLKIYNPDIPITLSDVLPILDNMGLKAISELPFEIKPRGLDQSVWVHDFLLEAPNVEFVDVRNVKRNFERAFKKIWTHQMENDSLNQLTLSANLNWHEITVLRTYVRYLKQIRFPFSLSYTEKALTENPKIARILVNMFKAFHNPEGKDGEGEAAGCAVAIDHALDGVDSLDQDRILRVLTRLIEATMRTNYFQRQNDGHSKPYLAIKIRSRDVPDIPEPKPFMEIFVYSPEVEAIHLRGDKIARGGLRWSDRHEDFRTEVLGLMKAQMVKNAVIVPMGAKGGFVVKIPTKSRDEFKEAGVACYKIFIQALLDITDNLKNGKVIPPQNVVRRDEDDPYLVVAADKGTATFSDIANELSLNHDFWLGDAFASGGSAGYDHKKMGITARGAWESVKAHFRHLNHNIQEQPFDVVGIGDMSGDVFGNGMLLSEHIRLIGAFNHLHIVCDPDPNPAASFAERQRLFDEVKGWDAYDKRKLSKGGQIYDRSEKILVLTPEIKERFDIKEDKVSPNDLIKAILKARTDLLWFGGIGTYIKSSVETHTDVGDKANDAVRVDAVSVRAKVIGEGANLAITQLGRVQYAQNGGRINCDFIDNSGGVDSSDHEVNIKILLSDVMSQKNAKMDIKSRNKLLEKMTDDVAALVLRSNYQQAQALSLAELQAPEQLQIQEEFIQDLERNRGLNRKLEALPDSEIIQNRLREGKGLTRPELAVLLCYSKIEFTHDLLASDIPDNPDMDDWLIGYFPDDLRKKYEDEITRHKLNREILATTMSNSLVNRMGPTFIKSCMIKTGAPCDDVAKAYIIVRDAFGLRNIWDAIESLDNKVPAEVQMKAMTEIIRLSEHAIIWFLTRLGRDLDIGKDIEGFKKGVQALRDNFDTIKEIDPAQNIDQHMEHWKKDGLPDDLARTIAMMPLLFSACDIIRIAMDHKADILLTGQTYFSLGARFHMDWLRQQARYLKADNKWQREAKSGLVDQLFSCQAGMTMRVLRDTACKGKNGKPLFECWLEDHQQTASQIDPLFHDLRKAGTIDLPMLIIAEQRLRHLYGG